MPQLEPGFYKVNDILDMFGIEKATLDDWLAKNEFPSPDLCIGDAGFWNKDTVDEFLAKKAGQKEPPKIEVNINVHNEAPEAEYLPSLGAKEYPVYKYSDLEYKFGMSRETIRVHVRQGTFPPPLELGVYCHYNRWAVWDKNIVDNFLATGTFPPEVIEYYTSSDLAYMLKITPVSIRYRVNQGKFPVPYVVISGKGLKASKLFYFWDKSVIDAFVKSEGTCVLL